jgi:hypothetical protein
MHESCSLKFGVILDILWWRKNEVMFSNKFIDSFKIKDKALATTRGIAESFYTMSNMNKHSNVGIYEIRWIPPEYD